MSYRLQKLYFHMKKNKFCPMNTGNKKHLQIVLEIYLLPLCPTVDINNKNGSQNFCKKLFIYIKLYNLSEL